MIVMSSQSFSMDGMKEAGSNSGEYLSRDRCSTEQQGGLICHRSTVTGVEGQRGLKKLIGL